MDIICYYLFISGTPEYGGPGGLLLFLVRKLLLSLYLHSCPLIALVAEFLEKMVFHGTERGRDLGV